MFNNKTNLQKFLAKLSKEEREEYQRQYDEVVFGDRKTISLTLLIPFFRDDDEEEEQVEYDDLDKTYKQMAWEMIKIKLSLDTNPAVHTFRNILKMFVGAYKTIKDGEYYIFSDVKKEKADEGD